MRDPSAATRGCITTVTPGQLAQDLTDLVLTFTPSGTGARTAEAVARQGARQAAEDGAGAAARAGAGRAGAGGAGGAGGHGGSGGPGKGSGAGAGREWTPHEVRTWLDGPETQVVRSDSPAYQYQHRVLGTDVERIVPTGVNSGPITADPVALYHGDRPGFLYEDLDEEVRRYDDAVNNPDNPLTGLTIVTNTEESVAFLAQQARSRPWRRLPADRQARPLTDNTTGGGTMSIYHSVLPPGPADLTIADRDTFVRAARAQWPGCRIITTDDYKGRFADAFAYPVSGDYETEVCHYPHGKVVACSGPLDAPGVPEVAAWARSLNPDPGLVLWLTDTFFTGHAVLFPGITPDQVRTSWVDHAEHDPTTEYPQYLGRDDSDPSKQ